MELHEKINQYLQPADKAMEQGLELMKKANIYDPFKRGFTNALKTMLLSNFKKNNDLAIFGTENVPQHSGCILASNHQSWLDAQVIGATAPRLVSFVAKAEFVDWPFLRHLIAITDSIFIRRTGDSSVMDILTAELRAGKAIAIFPEATIPGEEDIPRWDVEPETGLLKGKSGAVRLALAADVPIIPIGVSGTGRAFPPEAYPRMQKWPPLPGKGRIEIRFGKPIYLKPENGAPSYQELRNMTNQVMQAISGLVDHSMNYEPITLPIKLKTAPAREPRMAYRSKAANLEKKAPLGVLALHGFTSHIDCVADLRFELEELGIPYRMPWLRGHGGDWKDLKGVTSEDWYEDGEDAFLDLLEECEEVIIVGLSMGGLVAMDLAAHYRNQVAGVIGVATALKFKDPLAGLTGVISKVVPFWPAPNSYQDKTLKEKRNRNYAKFPTKAFASLYEYATTVKNRLSFVKAPALLIGSHKDQIIAPSANAIIYEKIESKSKKMVWFEESGHEMLLDLEAKKVRQTIKDFIEELMLEKTAATEEKPVSKAKAAAPAKKAKAAAPAKRAKAAAPARKRAAAKKRTPSKAKTGK